MLDCSIHRRAISRAWLAVTTLLLPLTATALGPPAATSPSPDVMIVGVAHMANPGHDLHNLVFDDVLVPERQAEIVRITHGLETFKPTKVAVEMEKQAADAQYATYLAGKLPPSRNERVQLGYRLANAIHSTTIYGIDADGDFPYEPLKAYADAHGFASLLTDQGKAIERDIANESQVLAKDGIAGLLRLLNTPERMARDQAGYRQFLRIGGNDTQPGVDLLTAWYRRNFLICANLLQISKPGDRIVVFYGAGHATLLRQCISETPGMHLVDANDYLPK
ncbi:MAG: DUF5694 domain-containing protein [Luteibacter sp.]